MRGYLTYGLIFSGLMMLSAGCASVPGLKHINNISSEIVLQEGETILIPMEDDAPEAVVSVFHDGKPYGIPYTARLAVDTVDYHIPYTADRQVVMRFDGIPFESMFSSGLRRGKASAAWHNGRPYMHFKPLYGWMNDPNGMVFKDGEWHLFYQYNPFGSKWGNLSWGHAVSEDLVHWTHLDVPLRPDSLGMVFSGCAVVDEDNTAGFGENAIVAVYTSAGSRQVQSLAYSTDNGRTFTKYQENPVLESPRPDFRDPKIFRYGPDGKWIMIISAGDAMEIYSSTDLKSWSFESRFGEGTGSHSSVWECPDLFELPWKDGSRWVMLCSSNRDPYGSAVQYFIGDFDGHSFVPDDDKVRWLDYGRDHYAAVTWNNAPDNRKILVAWESNWMYAADVPTVGYRGSMTVPRELSLMEYDGGLRVASYPVAEILEKCGKDIINIDVSSENPSFEAEGIEFTIDFEESSVSVFRKDAAFSSAYGTRLQARLEPKDSHDVLIVKEEGSVECFIDSGAVCITMLSL